MNPKEYRQSIYLFIEMKYGQMDEETKIQLSRLLHEYGQTVNSNYKEQIEELQKTNTQLRQTITRLTNK